MQVTVADSFPARPYCKRHATLNTLGAHRALAVNAVKWVLTKVQHEQCADDAVAAWRHFNQNLHPAAREESHTMGPKVCQNPYIRQMADLQGTQQLPGKAGSSSSNAFDTQLFICRSGRAASNTGLFRW